MKRRRLLDAAAMGLAAWPRLLAAQAHKLPSVWGGGAYLGEAGLASYQSDFPALWRRAGAIVAKVRNGAKPAELPFEQASKLERVLNLKAARRCGIVVPQSILISADEVIE